MARSNYSNSRNRRNRRKRKKKKIKYFRLLILVLLFVLIIFGVVLLIKSLVDRFKNNVGEEINKKNISEETTKKEKSSIDDDIAKIKSISEKSESDLTNRIKDYLAQNNLDEKKVTVFYNSLDKDKSINFSKVKNIDLKSTNELIFSMILEDLNRIGKIDFNEFIDMKQYDKDLKESTFVSLGDISEEMIYGNKEWIHDFIKNLIKEKTGEDWNKHANKNYSVNISDKNELNITDLNKILTHLTMKSNDIYLYNKTINSMTKNVVKSDDISKTFGSNIFGMINHSEYLANVEIGFLLNKTPFVYFIKTDYSEQSISAHIRNIIYNWVKDYN